MSKYQICYRMLQFCYWRYVTESNVTFVTKRVTWYNTLIHVDSWKIEPVLSCNKYWCRAKLALRLTSTKSLHAAKILATKILILVYFLTWWYFFKNQFFSHGEFKTNVSHFRPENWKGLKLKISNQKWFLRIGTHENIFRVYHLLE